MLMNLQAEQARSSLTDKDVSELLNINRETYTRKKNTQNFKLSEIKVLCTYFNCNFEYLFATESDRPNQI